MPVQANGNLITSGKKPTIYPLVVKKLKCTEECVFELKVVEFFSRAIFLGFCIAVVAYVNKSKFNVNPFHLPRPIFGHDQN